MTKRALVFAGTTEGNEITDYLSRNGILVTVSVATDYGKTTIQESKNVTVDSIRGVETMTEEMKNYDVIVDATHPYAIRKSSHIREACQNSGSLLIRIVRPDSSNVDRLINVPDTRTAAEYLIGTEGNVLVTTGSNELSEFTSIPGYKDRIFARVLSLPSVSEKCAELGFEGKNLICMRGPFSEDFNYALLKEIDAKYLVTKDSGTTGGFDEKILAAARAGVIPIVIGRPQEEGGVLINEAEKILSKLFSFKDPVIKRNFTIVGIGSGKLEGMTTEVRNAIKESDLLIGAARMLNSIEVENRDTLKEYLPDKIAEYLDNNTKYRNITVMMSGDTGYYSGTKGLLAILDNNKYNIKVLPGISSVSYFFSKINKSWDDAHLTSAHGRDCNIVGLTKRHKKLFTLLDKENTVHKVCKDLIEYGLENVTITVGQDFGTSNEKISIGSPKELLNEEFGTLCVAVIENLEASNVNPISISDETFIRGSTPMTKSEVRSLSVAKLKLGDNSIVYDVGAGTGSVSIEMALVAVSGHIYAVEKDEEASSLIDLNCKRFGTPNVTIIKGLAPEALSELPTPTHAFIGGSSGNLKSIIEVLINKNPNVRIVITSVTIETMAEAARCMKELNIMEEETICVNISKARIAGDYHLMTAQNPVYITVCRGNSV